MSREREFAIEALRRAVELMTAHGARDHIHEASFDTLAKRASAGLAAADSGVYALRNSYGKRRTEANKHRSVWAAVNSLAQAIETCQPISKVWRCVERAVLCVEGYALRVVREPFFKTRTFLALASRFPDVEVFLWSVREAGGCITILRHTKEGSEERTVSAQSVFAAATKEAANA